MNIVSQDTAGTVQEAVVAGGAIFFEALGLFGWLEAAVPGDLDALSFGLVATRLEGIVEHYNVAEADLTGLTPHRTRANISSPLRTLHKQPHRAQRFVGRARDRLRLHLPTPAKTIRPRLLKRPGCKHIYLAVKRRK
jgi:hypothetical protein